MNQYHNFSIPIIQSDQPSGWEAIQRGVQGSFNTLGQFARERQQKQQDLADAIRQMRIKAYLEQEMNKRAFQSNIEMMRGAGLFGDMGGQSGQAMPQPQINLNAAKSMGGGGFGDVYGNPMKDIIDTEGQVVNDTPMFLRKPSFQIDPMTGKVTMGISEVENPYFRQKMDIEKAKQIENQKPFSADEIKVSSQKSLIPQIDKLIELYKTKKVYEGFPRVPFGASRISAFGEEGAFVNPLKRGMTQGYGREAGLLLQNIKQLMFGPGGASLTTGERAVLGGMLSPAYKTEEKAVEDLITAKRMIEEKFRMLRANPNEAFSNEQSSPDDEYQRYLNAIGP